MSHSEGKLWSTKVRPGRQAGRKPRLGNRGRQLGTPKVGQSNVPKKTKKVFYEDAAQGHVTRADLRIYGVTISCSAFSDIAVH